MKMIKNPPKNIIDELRKKFNLNGSTSIKKEISKLFKIYPDSDILWNISGVVFLDLNKLNKAKNCFKNSININPSTSKVHSNLGTVFLRLKNYDCSIYYFQKAIKIDKKNIEAHNNLGNAFKQKRVYKNAINCYRDALKIDPFSIQVLINIGNTYSEIYNVENAIRYLKNALKIQPDNILALNDLGTIYKSIGKTSEAITYYKKAINQKPSFGQVHYNLCKLIKYTISDTHLLKMIELTKSKNINNEDFICLTFAISKAFEDAKAYKHSFKYLQTANTKRKKLLNYLIEKDQILFNKIKKTGKILSNTQNFRWTKQKKFKPIFILGMPRSGTTLVEQMLCSHPQIDYAGEQVAAWDFGYELITGEKVISKLNLAEFRNNYLNELSQFSNGKKFITDKMPQNFRLIGLIKIAIPEAKIVHVHRNPKAVCWSNFKHNFSSSGLGFANDLNDIVIYYKLYKDLMNFWNSSFKNYIIDINYENLVVEFEKELRNLISLFGLKWDNSCLKYYDNKRIINTASQSQVREELYQNSSIHWKKYMKFIGKKFDDLSEM